MPRPTDPLRAAHRYVLGALAAQAERLAGLEEAPREARAGTMAAVARALEACLRPHLAWEEDTLCPALDRFARGGPVRFGAGMRREHDALHGAMAGLWRRAGDPSEVRAFRRDAAQLIADARRHLEREERVLFPVLDRLLGSAASSRRAVAVGRPPVSP